MGLGRAGVGLAASLLLALPAHAREPLVADRPGTTESSLTVGPGVYQIEQGVTVTRGGPSQGDTFPSLHRLGLGETFELRLESPVMRVNWTQVRFVALALGAKWQVFHGDDLGQLPSLALLAQTTVDDRVRVVPQLKLLADTTLPGEVDLGVNLGAFLPAGTLVPALVFAVSLSHPVAESLTATAGVSGNRIPSSPDDELGVDGALAYQLNPDTQVDLGVFAGLSPASPTLAVSAGLSMRFGK